MSRGLLVLAVLGMMSVCGLRAESFFTIENVTYDSTEPSDGLGVWFVKYEPKGLTKLSLPSLDVRFRVKENVPSEKVVARVYFFDANNKRIAMAMKPSPSGKKSEGENHHFPLPAILEKGRTGRMFFVIPEAIRNQKWKAVVVFGDQHELVSSCYPTFVTADLLDYPEKNKVAEGANPAVDRKAVIDPLIQHVVKTKDPNLKLTLFFRPPAGISNAADIKGVLAISVLSNSVEDMKRILQREELPDDYEGLFKFANENKLAILAWGIPNLWNASVNVADLLPDEAKRADDAFNLFADAWERGVSELCGRYKITKKNFLLWGSCGSAQSAHRLCLRKPDYFLAIYIHIPGSFDVPTAGANKVIWCLTTGEHYGGYERSKRFVAECRKLGYPIIFKAIMGLGHGTHPDARALSFKFFEYALSMKEQREAFDRTRVASSPGKSGPWLEAFRNPPFFGDMINQELYPAGQVANIPAAYRVPLPSKEIADIWLEANE